MAAIHSDLLLFACGSASVCCPSLRRFSLSFTNNIPIRKVTARMYPTYCTPDSPAKLAEKPPVCTADELHYVTVPNSDWRLALWRYLPSPKSHVRNHPLLLLSGVGTNAIGYDLSPECSFARHMSNNGYDTWILEVRGAGLSLETSLMKDAEISSEAVSKAIASIAIDYKMERKDGSIKNSSAPSISESKKRREIAVSWDESKLVSSLSDTFMRLSDTLSEFLNEAQLNKMSSEFLDRMSTLLEDTQLSESLNDVRVKLSKLMSEKQNSNIAVQMRSLSERLVNIIEEGQRSVSPPFVNMQERLFSTIEDFQRQLDLIVKFNWDFDNLLEDDIPAVISYIKRQTNPKDGKLLAVGHSMGGILLYSMLSKYGYEGKEAGLAAIVTLASSLDYSCSDSKFKMFEPLVDPVQALKVPVLPLGTILAATFPLSSRPPYALSWLKFLFSADNMMHPDMLEKLAMNNFCTVPMKLVYQLHTVMSEGGLRDRSGTFVYKDHLHKTVVPVLAVAGDQDLLCPPEAVLDTVRALPPHLVTYLIFGEDGGPHYAHYDLVGSKLAKDQIYPCVLDFLNLHDRQSSFT